MSTAPVVGFISPTVGTKRRCATTLGDSGLPIRASTADASLRQRALSEEADEDISPEDLIMLEGDDGSEHFAPPAPSSSHSEKPADPNQSTPLPSFHSRRPVGEGWGIRAPPINQLADKAPALRNEGWKPQQHAYRRLLCALRDAYYNDRSRLFWARHKARVEFYKYGSLSNDADLEHAVNVCNEISQFISKYMRVSVERIQKHNESILALSVPDAKKFREAYLLREAQHESWCKQKIRDMLQRRPPPPYPYC